MDLVSLLIMLLGIVVLLGLYLMSRLYDQQPARQADKDISIPVYTDTNGKQLSSIKVDIPAKNTENPAYTRIHKTPASRATQAQISTPAKNQHVLFIAAQTPAQLSGDKIVSSMQQLGLTLGEKDIYHYTIKDKNLFSIANGIAPWTLKDSDLLGKTTPGLSLIMKIPTPIDSAAAIDTFVDIAEKLALSVNGELQNAQQQLFLPTDKETLLNSHVQA